MKQIFAFVILLLTFAELVSGAEKIHVLILSGQNNHNWQETTPVLKDVLEGSDRFSVTVLKEPGKITSELLSDYTLILSNWNRFPDVNSNWSEETKTAFLNFVKDGGGVVFVHAATTVNQDWQAFMDLAGATWGEGTRHGKKAWFELVFSGVDHPITNGMSNFWIKDELWVNMQNFNTSRTLASAFSPKANKGRDMMETVLMEQRYGKGRSVFLGLGHDAKSMQNLGFQTLLQRSSEWAATGKVKQAIPPMLMASNGKQSPKYIWEETENALSLKNKKKLIMQLNFDKTSGKPFFHPLKSHQGIELSWLRPKDHPWHRGIWYSWKFINGLNYWEEDRITGISEGITQLVSVKNEINKHVAISTMRLSYHPPNGEEVLSEQRKITITQPDEAGNYFIDWHATFTAESDEVILDRTPLIDEANGKRYGGYAGFSARFHSQLWDVIPYNDKASSHQLHGKESKWLSYQFRTLRGGFVTVSIFDHPNNFRHPNRWFVETSEDHPFYFFSPSPLFSSKVRLKKGETLKLNYRMLISPSTHDEVLIKKYWNNFKSINDE